MGKVFPYKLFELDFIQKGIFMTDKKYFITNGTIGLFGNNKKVLCVSMNVLLNK